MYAHTWRIIRNYEYFGTLVKTRNSLFSKVGRFMAHLCRFFEEISGWIKYFFLCNLNRVYFQFLQSLTFFCRSKISRKVSSKSRSHSQHVVLISYSHLTSFFWYFCIRNFRWILISMPEQPAFEPISRWLMVIDSICPGKQKICCRSMTLHWRA